MLKKILTFVVVIVLGVGIAGGYRWYSYVTAAPDPLDEVGIDLNSRMPMPLRKWGCFQMQKRFGDRIPPYGCQSSTDGTKWM